MQSKDDCASLYKSDGGIGGKYTKIDDKEKQNYEFKQSWQDEALKEIVSFANSDGGTVYISINDFGEIVRLDDSKNK